MASLAPYDITLGGTDYPAKYAGLLAYIEPFLTNLETFSFSGGNVGVGSGSPIEKLHIIGNIYSLRIGGAKLRLADQNNEVSVESLPVGLSSEMVFKTSAVERMRLDASGNLGLGVTPSAWGSSERFIDIGSTVAVGTGGSAQALVAFNAFINSSGQYVYKISSFASVYEQLAGQHKWYTAPSGTAGNAISFTEAMTLDASGRLQIGTTTANAKLTVSGSVSWTTGASFAGAAGNTAWATGFGSQAISTSIQASDSIAGANIYAISDVRLKSNIKPIPSGLAFVKEVSAVQFTWNESGIEDTGFIAQDLLKKGFGHLVSAIPDGAMKELVHDDGNVSPAGSRFVVKYDSVVPILCKAIQEQQALIENLLARVAALEEP
jgi:hypothetical protein